MLARLLTSSAIALIAVLVVATAADSNTGVPIKNGNGATISEEFITLPSGNLAPSHVLVDGTGAPYGATNPLLTAPAVYSVQFTDHSGTIAAAGATVVDIQTSTLRKGGSIRAATTNTGLIAVTLKDASGNLHVEHLAPGESYTLTVNGYVIQVEILVAGDTVGDTFAGVTFQ